MAKYYRVIIVETARDNPKQDVDEDRRFNHVEELCIDLDKVKEYLTERYGKMPGMKKKIYQDPDNKVIGFLHSFWNKDISHDSKSWWQTDWVQITEVTETVILI